MSEGGGLSDSQNMCLTLMEDSEVHESMQMLLKMGKEDFIFYSKIIHQLWADKKEVKIDHFTFNEDMGCFKTEFISSSTRRM